MTTKLTTLEAKKIEEFEKLYFETKELFRGGMLPQDIAFSKSFLRNSLHQHREMIRKGVDNKIAELLRSFANTPVKDRKNAWDYLVECRPKILALLSNKDI